MVHGIPSLYFPSNSTSVSPALETGRVLNLTSHKLFLLSENENNFSSDINWTTSTESPSISVGGGAPGGGFPGKNVIIPLYTVIFVLSIVGNLLVIVTLVRNRRMRTVTNVFLLNLAVSDLLLGVFCVPITLVGQILKNFIFGHLMCKLIPYFQALSISVSAWTLTAISCERFFAICRPLQSRKWQTRSHAYKIIAGIWVTTLTWNIPITFVSQLQPIRDTGRFKCREIWPNPESEKIFNLFLDFLLLLIPLCIMGMAYSLIVSKLWKGLRREILHTRSFTPASTTGIMHPEPSLELSGHSHYSVCKLQGNSTTEASRNTVRVSSPRDGVSNEIMTFRGGKGVVVRWKRKEAMEGAESCNCPARKSSPDNISNHQCQSNRPIPNHVTPVSKFSRAIRSTYTGKSIESKKKVIRMLFVLVAEFFLSWTPLFVMNTWYLFNPEAVYNRIGPMGIAVIQLLAYTSSCTNPITYCFMNRKFRQAFLKVFQFGCTPRSKTGPPTIGRGSDLSANDSLIYGVQGSTINKSEVVVLHCEDRV